MNQVLIGTSGYSYKDWVGPVYPPGTASKDYLKVYSSLFTFTEINSTYYRQPDPRTMERLVAVTPDGFRFSVKAFGGITHGDSSYNSSEINVFRTGIKPLVDAGRLVAVLLQFPYSFHYTPQNRQYLDKLCGGLAGLSLAVEFRERQWQQDRVVAGLAARGATFVNVDQPLLAGLMVPSSYATEQLGYVRFHGRNSANWWSGDNASRYDYLYSEDELAEWVPRIRVMGESTRTMTILFNNHWRGQAVANALRMRELINELNEGFAA